MWESLWDDFTYLFAIGGWVTPPLILLTLVLWYAIGYRFAVLRRGNRRSVRVLLERYSGGYERAPRGVVDGAVVHALKIAAQQPAYLRRRLDDAFWERQRQLRRFNRLIYTIVGIAPLLGLLGTVIGMVETFDSLGDMALFSQSGGIAGGISQALFTTQLGLAVAIPGVVVGRLLQRRQQSLELDLALIKDILCSAPGTAQGET